MKNEAELVSALTLSSDQAPSTQPQAEKDGLEEWVDKPVVRTGLPVLKPPSTARRPVAKLAGCQKPRSLVTYRLRPVSLDFQSPRQRPRVYYYGKQRDYAFHVLSRQPPPSRASPKSLHPVSLQRPATGVSPQRTPRSLGLNHLLL